MINISFKIKKAFCETGTIAIKYNPLYNKFVESEDKLQPFNTDEVVFNYPSSIVAQESYDGSTNLIINDTQNRTCLVNTKFSILDDNKYRIINRYANYTSNIYNEGKIVFQSSLYKVFSKFLQIDLVGIQPGGNLKVGNYVVYIKYADQDGNATNIAGESSIIPCFIGENQKADGAYENYNSNKSIVLNVSNIDENFNNLVVYYSRSSSDKFSLTSTTIYKIITPFPIVNQQDSKRIIITGNENTEEITQEQLNTDLNIANSVETIDKSSSRLYLGNINQYTVDYQELSDLSLRIYPTVVTQNLSEGHSNPQDIYYNVGYWNEEMYRFGIVYLYNNNTYSPVFNVLGIESIGDATDLLTNPDEPDKYNKYYNKSFSIYKEHGINDLEDPTYLIRNYLKLNIDDQSLELNPIYNYRGVSRIKVSTTNINNPLHIKFIIPAEVLRRLKQLNISGYFFVRQKRIPTILAQGKCLPHAKYVGAPTDVEGYLYGITNQLRNIPEPGKPTQSKNACCCICPDYTVRPGFYNTLFTGDSFPIKVIGQDGASFNYVRSTSKIKIAAVKEDTPAVVIDGIKFSSRLGEAADATKFAIDLENRSDLKDHWVKTAGDKKDNGDYILTGGDSNIAYRGIIGPFLGIVGNNNTYLYNGKIINIYIQGYSETKERFKEYFKIRYDDNSPYYAISTIFTVPNSTDTIKIEHICGRGDCYNCYFTERLLRNFQDPSSPNNDTIVKAGNYNQYAYNTKTDSWVSDTINRGDINAVQLGQWIGIGCYSTNNLNIRSIDRTHPEETALTGKFRSFYAITGADRSGNNKIPESQFINEGFSQSLGQRVNFLQAEVPYIKSDFQNRIMYSDIYISDAYQNGFRIFRQGNFVDYSSNYGGITRIMEYQGNLAIIFEHGIGISQIGQNESSVLSETPLIVSNQYGSLWHDSIVQTQDSIYGVDTDAKKIWRLRGQELTVISEFNIESYLQKNINLNQHDVIPSYDFKRVVTHYNAAKKDVIFTFYHRGESDFDELDENNKVIQWSLCWNEYLEKWQTFYSWMPFLSENINNIFFTLAYDNPYIWKHGNAGNYRYQDKLLPTFWYGKQHPFEFEFVVRADISTHKIFNNLEIISNNAEPESFHYEISPDCYDFAEDLNNMYFRQEHTKFFEREYNYRVLGKVKKIRYDEDVINNEELQTGIEQFVIEPKGELTQSGYYNKRSTLLPLKYYVRDTDENLIEDYYHETTSPSKDFKNLSGTEIISTSDGLKLQEHCIAADMRKVGRLRGNMYFKENKWFIQINPINFCQRNEYSTSWKLVENHWYPPIILQERLPKDWQVQGDILETTSPYLLKQAAIELDNWTNRQEIKLKDKYMKVKIRYTGDKLAIINSVITMYSEI